MHAGRKELMTLSPCKSAPCANDIMPTKMPTGAPGFNAAVSSECPHPTAHKAALRNVRSGLSRGFCAKGFSVPYVAVMIPRCIQRSHFALRRVDVHSYSSPHGLRFLSAPPTPTPSSSSKFSRYGRKAVKYTAFTCFSAVLGLSVVVGGVFIHDVFTYTDRHIDRVPVSPLALHPQRGGPKNLPVASVLVGDEDDDAVVSAKDKPRLVIVGGGWGVRFDFLHTTVS